MAEQLVIRLFAWWPVVLLCATVAGHCASGGDQVWSWVYIAGFVSWLVGGIGALIERDYLTRKRIRKGGGGSQ